MELSSSFASAVGVCYAKPTAALAGPRLLPSLATPAARRNVPHSGFSSSSSSISTATVIASDGLREEEPSTDADPVADSNPTPITSERKALITLLLSLGFALGSAEAAMALGPEGPLVEEFWDNMRRYGLYFLTVFTGGLYSIVQPIFSLLRNPITAILTVVFLSGSFYLLYLLLNSMLGITAFNYDYA